VQEPVRYLKRISRERLASFGGRAAGSHSRWVEHSVVARTIEAIILRFPPNLAAQVWTDTGKSDEVFGVAVAVLSGNVDRLSGRSPVANRFADLYTVCLDHKLPNPFAR